MFAGLKNIAAGNPAHGEIEILTPNGKRNAEYNSNPIHLNGKVVGYQTMLRDVTERKKAEEALRESEEKHRKLFEGATTAIRETSTKDQHGNVVWAANVITSPIKDGKRNVFAALEVAVPTTCFKKMELKLREAENRYHALFNGSPVGVLVIDPETAKFVEFNDVAHQSLGYSREEFSKLAIQDIEAKETRDEVIAHIAAMVKKGGAEFETEHRTKNGEIRNVLVSTNTVELNNKIFLQVIFHDITEIRKVQDALMKSETQYRQLVNVAQEGIWALDSNYSTVFVNPKMAKMLGYVESELVGKSLLEFLDKKCTDQARQFLEQFKQGGEGYFDCELNRKNGSRVYVSIASSVIMDDDGKPSGIMMMVSDITDRKALERKVDNYSKHLKSMVELRTAQLKDANERLVRSERLAAIGELAGMIGHDLRNPLTGIKNAAYYLKKKGATCPEDQAKEMLEIIDKAIEHSNKIINDLLDYSREIRLELTEIETSALLNEAMRMIQVPDRIQVVNHVLGETWLKVDADKMMRVFINLIKNAVDAMPEGGTLEITSRQTGGKVEIAFADTGKGIPEEILQKIFMPLFTTKAQGMGFGLAICKRIIDSHGGTITVETVVNKGTTFTITLPIKPKLEAADKEAWVNMPESLSLTVPKTLETR
jgi:PAS domain S-box-containing protein